jgi:hypothetical protein
MAVGYDLTSFSAGEIAPALFGHVDLAKFNVAAATLRNMYVGFRGGVYSRAGTAYCGRSKQSHGAAPPRVITFQFSISQGYALEFGDNYMRVFYQGSPVVENAFAIGSLGGGSVLQLSIPGNNYQAGDWFFVSDVASPPQVNGATYLVMAVAGSVVTVADLNGNPIDGSAFAAYSGGGAASRIYTLATPWAAADLPLLKFTQSADVMSFTHQNYPPYDLTRISATDWVIAPAQFGAAIAAPTFCIGGATTPPSQATDPVTLPAAYAYVATAVAADTGEESVASPVANIVNGVDIAQTAGSNIITISAVPGASSYNIYKAPTSYNTAPGNTVDAEPVPAGASFGYCGTIFGTQFVDSNVTADFTQVPPVHSNPFAPGSILGVTIGDPGTGYTGAEVGIASATGSGFVGAGVIVNGGVVAIVIQNGGQGYQPGDVFVISGDGSGAAGLLDVGPETGTYPGCVAYFQQRRVYASTLNNPDTYWMSQPGAFLNFDSSIPVTDSDSITGTPWSQQVNGIQAMVSMPGGLVVLTGRGAWQVAGAGSSALSPQAITPSDQQAQPQAFNGCSATVPPITINFDILYVQAKGSIVRDLNYNFFLNVYTGVDLTQISGHLFTGYQIREWAWCEEPFKVLWAVRDDYTLLSLTYLKEQEVYGWGRHDTAGQFISVCSVVEPPTDALYLVTRRFATNNPYYIERMDSRTWFAVEDCWCVDAGLRYPMPTPSADLACYALTGSTPFVTDGAVFNVGSVGSVIRAAGGIAVITQVISATEVVANIIKPITQFVSSNGTPIVSVASGDWTMTAPVTEISGLVHLAGLTVTGLADGVVIPPTVVSAAGTITLAAPASAITVGLPFQAQFQSTYANPATQPTEQGRRKDIVAATARVEASAMIKAGTDQTDGSTLFPPGNVVPWTRMTAVKDQGDTYTTPGGATALQLYTGDMRVNLFASFRKPGQVALQQDNPLPMNILDLVPEGLDGDTPEQTYSQQQPRDPRQGARGPGAWMLSA